jgi:thiamine pyrophosphokinase
MFIRAMFLIVAGGEQPGKQLLNTRVLKASMIIAADKGARYCLDAGIKPHLVVGDMDSLDDATAERIAAAGATMKRFSPDKDRSDTQIALEEAIQHGAKNVEILGAIGDRLDHTLANIHLLYMALKQGVAARIISESQQVFLVDSSETIKDSQGCTVSFLPLTERVEGIALKGFRYELEDAAMEIGNPYGLSNVVKSDEAFVTVEKGILLALLINA